MTTIGLIRHGITEWNELGKAQGISDIPLNETGIRQARAIAGRVSGERWDLVVSSDLKRARQTAEAICAALSLPSPLFDERLRELNCGLIEGTTEEERVVRWGEEWWSQDLGMERYEEVAQRGVAAIQEISAKHQGKRILIVSHGALIGLSLQRLLPDVFSKTYIDNTSLTLLTREKDVWACTLYNCTQHLL